MELSLSFWFSPTVPEDSGPGRQCHRATESQGCPERHGTPARLQFQTSLGSFYYQHPVQYLRSLNSLKVFFVYLKFNSSWCQDLVAICLFLISMVPYSRQGLWTPDPGLHLDFPPSDLCVCGGGSCYTLYLPPRVGESIKRYTHNCSCLQPTRVP